ncbi:signal peptidase I [Candidatus Daviesbacteria bacterium RIFCSPLOWO2_02_FULL_36_7]|uniref:Signal peptidase I n=1 Tax=Candidatus Daviesbacteria bacterium RIFCSPLOWO2_02_FULL_36_7 TaxID=1797792 RepID=A0A1F5MH08_9BACT|nr:MAG: signal peptidase I [Candidatus Daviesbacteria bacterium RIFCSPLOWO2_02_FULL_36_7]
MNYGDTPPKGFFENFSGYVVEFIETIVVFGAIFAAIYLFVAQFHKVSGNSMVPTFHNGDFLITEKVSYKMRNPQHGEIVVLKNPKDESQDFIKRIIAVPGDTLQISNNTVYVNDNPLKENYIPADYVTRPGAFVTEGTTITAAGNQYFVFGDNREHSSDSREWGPVTKEELVGRAFLRYWPPQAIGLLTNK